MAAMDFPNSPTVGQTYTVGNSSWTWNGTTWDAVTGYATLYPLTIKSDSGTTEGTDLYTFTGASSKTINLVSGTGVTIAETSGTLTFNNSGVTSVNGSTGAITNVLTSSTSGVQTFLTTPSSANLKTIITDGTGDGSLMFSIDPLLTKVDSVNEGGQIRFQQSNGPSGSEWFIDSYWDGSTTQLRIVNGTGGINTIFKPDGSLSVPNGTIIPMAGSTTEAPIDFQVGNNLTTPVQGAMEFDGDLLYITGNTSTGSGRQIIGANQYYYLSSGASSIAAGTDYFPSSRPAMLAGHMYNFRFWLHFTKNTNGTVTFQLKNSAAVNFTYISARLNLTNQNGVLPALGAFMGGQASAAATLTMTATPSLTNNSSYTVVVEGYCIPASNTRLSVTPSAYGAGTITTLAGSTFFIYDLGAANIGNFG